MTQIIPNPEAFERLRALTQALPLTPGEKSGPMLNALTPIHIAQVNRAFDSEGASTGKVWAPWSAAYAAWRQKQGGRGILELTGRLRAAITMVTSGSFYRSWVSPSTYNFGFLDQIGAWHVTGTKFFPSRSMMTKTEADAREFLQAFFEYWKARTLAIVRNESKISATHTWRDL